MKKLILILAIPFLVNCKTDDFTDPLDCMFAAEDEKRERKLAIEDGDTERADELLIIINNKLTSRGCPKIK